MLDLGLYSKPFLIKGRQLLAHSYVPHWILYTAGCPPLPDSDYQAQNADKGAIDSTVWLFFFTLIKNHFD